MCLRNLPLLHGKGLVQLRVDGASGLHHSFCLAAYSDANRWLFRAGSGYMIRTRKLSIQRMSTAVAHRQCKVDTSAADLVFERTTSCSRLGWCFSGFHTRSDQVS